MLRSPGYRREWVIMVWLVVAFVLFPLTPPISQQISFDEPTLGQSNETLVCMRLEPSEACKWFPPPKAPVLGEDHILERLYIPWIIIYLCFLLSKIPKLLKRSLLAPLKFTSMYVIASS
ncbi:hypothetical protein O9H85_07150 [Paenibacillus filicis]|uniref:Uncharacterized protein n=1 Tax=Paenibacillus gyeongsangnamensis TaxID=3388067 RepID=A0ABT4Q5U1_9BACL|nr:hypothetical protein [Paenibacillus filicis]MCZ8512206.1 hypothetical protein [Paenibacillus filicis]